MALDVRLSIEAANAIEAIGDHIAADSPGNALRWIAKLRAAIDRIGVFPTKHAVLYMPEQAGREVRQTFYGVYRILYEIREDIVFVLAVRHGARRPIGPAEVKDIE